MPDLRARRGDAGDGGQHAPVLGPVVHALVADMPHAAAPDAASTSSATKGSQQAEPRQQQSLPNGMVGRTALDTFMASGAHAKAGVYCGGGSRKRKYHYTELEMIEQRLAYWYKVKCELPPMQYDGAGDCPDQITMIFREAVHYVADHTSGVYAVLNDEHDRITDAFAACVRRVTSSIICFCQLLQAATLAVLV